MRTLSLFAFVIGIELYAYQALATIFPGSSVLPIIYFSITAILIAAVLLFVNAGLKNG